MLCYIYKLNISNRLVYKKRFEKIVNILKILIIWPILYHSVTNSVSFIDSLMNIKPTVLNLKLPRIQVSFRVFQLFSTTTEKNFSSNAAVARLDVMHVDFYKVIAKDE